MNVICVAMLASGNHERVVSRRAQPYILRGDGCVLGLGRAVDYADYLYAAWISSVPLKREACSRHVGGRDHRHHAPRGERDRPARIGLSAVSDSYVVSAAPVLDSGRREDGLRLA